MRRARVSGTFWERQLCSTVPIILFFTVCFGAATGDFVSSLFGLSILPGSILVLIDLYTYSRFQLREVRCGSELWIDTDRVIPEQVISIRCIRLRSVKNSWDFVELHYRKQEQDVYALCIAKPHLLLIGEAPTIRIIEKHFPELQQKRLGEYTAHGIKEVRDPSARRPDPPPLDDPQPSATARYRDPYFQGRIGKRK